jgi:hypothetical protein
LSDIVTTATISTMMDKKDITPNKRNNVEEREGSDWKPRSIEKPPGHFAQCGLAESTQSRNFLIDKPSPMPDGDCLIDKDEILWG